MKKMIFAVFALATLLAACSGEKSADTPAPIIDKHPGDQLIDRFVEAYTAKDAEAYLALHEDQLLTVLYPDRLFGSDLAAMEVAVRDDFLNRPEALIELPDRFQVASDQWVAHGVSINGEQRAPMMIIFDLNGDNTGFEASYTHIGSPGFVGGASVTAPTPGMMENLQLLVTDLQGEDITSADIVFSADVALYTYPPKDISNYAPVITGASDVASVLAFKWGAEAFAWRQPGGHVVRDDTFISRHMQYVFVAIPGSGDGLDRVIFFTFGADPDAETFEKIIRVDVMGPGGG